MKNVNKPEVSVIVPVYNASSYIEHCVSTLLNQQTTWEYEIILVNDGSTDNSLEILKDLQNRDVRIHIYTKDNGGVSSARNFGLEKAKGDYVVFVDSDDWVDETYIQHLRDSVVAGQHGVTFTGFVEETPHGPIVKRQQTGIYHPTKYHEMMDDRRIYNQGIPWGKIYDLSTIRANNVNFPLGIQFGEDLIFLLTYLQYAEYVKFIDTVDYHYSRLNEGSLIASYHSFQSEINGYRKFRDTLQKLKSQYSITDNMLQGTHSWLIHFAMRSVKTMYRPGANHLPLQQRISCLKSEFADADREFFAHQYQYEGGINKIICMLMGNGHYLMLDTLLKLFFSLRYSPLGKSYLNHRRS